MLFPAHALDATSDMSILPPTDFMLKMRKWILFIGLVQFLCVIARISVGDVMGAICMSIVVSMVYMIAWGSPPLHIRWVFMWAFFCFINAGFDFAIAAVRTVHVYEHYDHPGSHSDVKARVPLWQICIVLLSGWLGAFSEIAGALVGYKVFQDFQDHELQAYINDYGANFGLLTGNHGVGFQNDYGTNNSVSSAINGSNYNDGGNHNGSGLTPTENVLSNCPHNNANSSASDPNAPPRFSGHVGRLNETIDPFGNTQSRGNTTVQPFQGKAHKLDVED